jgi:hypothetical protein
MNFRHSAGFGKRIKYWVVGEMLKEGIDVYMPLVDDMAIDAVIRKQIKNPNKDGLVTIAGKPSDDFAPGTLNSIIKQAGLK